MPRKGFTRNIKDKLDEIDRLIEMDRLDAEDEATIGNFYNGRATMSEAEAEDRGVDNMTNHLFGFDSIASAKAQLDAILTKDPNLWHVEIENAPPIEKDRWEQRATFHLNNAIRRSRRFKEPWKGLTGNVTLHGRGVLCFQDDYDWCPKLVRPLVPPNTGILARDIPFAVFPDRMTMRELKDAVRHAERVQGELESESAWNLGQLQKLIRDIEENIGHEVSNDSSQITAAESAKNSQEGVSDSEANRLTIPVFYFYESRPDKPGRGFDLTIIARYYPKNRKASPGNTAERPRQVGVEIYNKEMAFERAEHWMHPFFIDTAIGDETSWHRVQGLGRLNFDADVETEEFFNDAMEGSRENLRRMWRVQNGGDTEMLNRWLSEEGLSNVIPEGVDAVEVNKNPNFQYAFQVIEMLRQLSATKARGSLSNTGDKSVDELEVQALERQGRAAAAMATRIGEIYDNLDHLGEEVVRRFLNTEILEIDSGYEEIKYFQDCLKADGIPIDFLKIRSRAGDRFKNLVVKTNRAAGDGNKVQEIMVNRMLLQRLPMFNPEAQQMILRKVVASETQDHDLAEALVPREDRQPSVQQITIANNENDTCHLRGITNYVPPIGPTDLHQIHIPEHLGGMQAMVLKGQAQGWTVQDFHGFRCLGTHTVRHIQLLSASPQHAEIASAFMASLQEISQAGQQLAQQVAAQQEQQDLSPVEQEKIIDMRSKRDLATRAQLKLEEHREDSLELSERKAIAQKGIQEAQQAEAEVAGIHRRNLDEADRIIASREQTTGDRE